VTHLKLLYLEGLRRAVGDDPFLITKVCVCVGGGCVCALFSLFSFFLSFLLPLISAFPFLIASPSLSSFIPHFTLSLYFSLLFFLFFELFSFLSTSSPPFSLLLSLSFLIFFSPFFLLVFIFIFVFIPLFLSCFSPLSYPFSPLLSLSYFLFSLYSFSFLGLHHQRSTGETES
jgi:hypothetical protein